jgi:hypothetical protein
VKPPDISRPKRKYLKEKINELPTCSNNKNIRDPYREINEFKKGCQRETNLAKDGNDVVLTDFKHILNRRKNCFSHLFNALVHWVSDVKHMEIHADEQLVPEPGLFEVETATAS